MQRELNTKKSVRVVTSNNFFRASGLEDISLKAKKLLYLTIAQCRKDDNELYEYSISAVDFARIMGVVKSHVYEEADKITDELMKGFIKIQTGKKSFQKFQLFQRCEYSDGILYIQLSNDMENIVLHLKKDFTQPLLSDFMHMRSSFSMAVWHLFQREMGSKQVGVTEKINFYLSLEELRLVTGTTKTFRQVGQFKERVLDKSISEIENQCGVVVTYENVKKGRFVVGFNFTAQSLYYVEMTNLPLHFVNQVTETKRRLLEKNDNK